MFFFKLQWRKHRLLKMFFFSHILLIMGSHWVVFQCFTYKWKTIVFQRYVFCFSVVFFSILCCLLLSVAVRGKRTPAEKMEEMIVHMGGEMEVRLKWKWRRVFLSALEEQHKDIRPKTRGNVYLPSLYFPFILMQPNTQTQCCVSMKVCCRVTHWSHTSFTFK